MNKDVKEDMKFEVRGIFVCPECGHDLSSIEDMPKIEKHFSEHADVYVRAHTHQQENPVLLSLSAVQIGCPKCKTLLLLSLVPTGSPRCVFQRSVRVGSWIKYYTP